MDYRKLIGFSKGSFVVTMPKYWIERHNLKKGDMVGIEENSDELVFYASDKEIKKEEKSISIDTRDKKLSMIKAEIVTAYLNNYNTIEIFSETLDEDAPVIKGILRNLSGMEIIEQTGKRIVAKDLLDENSISIQSVIRRMDIITRSMIDDTILCIEEKRPSKGIMHRDSDVNRLYYLGFRIIKNAIENPIVMNRMKTNPWRLQSDKIVMSLIEEIADRQKRISRSITEVQFRNKSMIKLFKEIKEDLKNRYYEVMKAYYNNDKKIAYDLEITNIKFIERCNDFIKDITKDACLYCKRRLVRNSADKAQNQKVTTSMDQDTFTTNVVSAAMIVEYTKATAIFIKHIAREVLNMD